MIGEVKVHAHPEETDSGNAGTRSGAATDCSGRAVCRSDIECSRTARQPWLRAVASSHEAAHNAQPLEAMTPIDPGWGSTWAVRAVPRPVGAGRVLTVLDRFQLDSPLAAAGRVLYVILLGSIRGARVAVLSLDPLSDPIVIPSGAATLVAEAAGAGLAVVCLHAGVTDRRSWRPVAPYLTEDHLVVAYDRRGFGDTTASREPFDHVADLRAVLDHFGITRAVLVGNSQGGRVAMDAALEHRDRIAGVVMVAAAWTGAPDPDGPWPDWLVEIDRLGDEADVSGDLDRINDFDAWLWLDGPRGPKGRIDGPARTLFLDMNRRALAVNAAGGVGDETNRGQAWDRLGSVEVPVAVVECALDLPWAPARGRAAADALPDATYVELDTAHLPGLEQPEALAAVIRNLAARSETAN